MAERFKEKEFQIWGILAIIILLVWGITVRMFYASHKNSEKIYLHAETKRFQGEVNSTLRSYEEFSSYIFDEINRDEKILSIIHRANSASDEEKKLLREELYNKLSDKNAINLADQAMYESKLNGRNRVCFK